MKRNVFFVCLICTLLVPLTLYAQSPEKTFYVGVGGNYALENFDGGDFDDSFGFNAKFGLHAHRLLDVEFNFDWFDKFDDSGTITALGTPINWNSELEIMTYMLTLKGYFPFSLENLRLAVVVGGGLMNVDGKSSIDSTLISGSFSADETDFCGKLGLAFDYYPTREISIGTEVNYTWAFGDLDGIEYVNFSIGVAYHF